MVTKAKNSTLEATISVVNVGTGMDVLVNEAPSQQSVIAKSIKAKPDTSVIVTFPNPDLKRNWQESVKVAFELLDINTNTLSSKIAEFALLLEPSSIE